MNRICLLVLVIICFSCRSDNPVEVNPSIGDNFDFRLTDSYPAWSHTDGTIAYVHGDTLPGKSGIWLIDTSGTYKDQLYESNSASLPAWSPDSRWLAFSDQGQIFKLRLSSDSLMQLTSQGRNFFPSWSADNQWIAYDRSLADQSGPGGVWIMKLDGSAKTPVTGGAFPDWFPDGKSLVVAIGTSPTSVWKRFEHVYPFQATPSETLSAIVGNENDFPHYSPDGSQIAFTSAANGSLPQIYVMNSDGKTITQLTTTQGYSCSWSPDGMWIVYTDSRASNGRLWLMRKDGSMKRQLTFD